MSQDNPTPADAEKELEAIKLDVELDNVLAHFAQGVHMVVTRERYDKANTEAKRRLQSLQDGARKETVLRLSDWAVSHDLTRGSNNRVTFDVDEWNAIREKVAQLSHPAPEGEQP